MLGRAGGGGGGGGHDAEVFGSWNGEVLKRPSVQAQAPINPKP